MYDIDYIHEKLPDDIDVVLRLLDKNKNYVTPYAYTADENSILNHDFLGKSQKSDFSALDGKELDALFQIESEERKEKHDGQSITETSSDETVNTPYGSGYLFDFADLIGFQRQTFGLVLNDIQWYLNFISEDPLRAKEFPHPQNSESVLLALHNSVMDNMRKGYHEPDNGMVHFSSPGRDTGPGIKDPEPQDKPNLDQLTLVQDHMADVVSKHTVGCPQKSKSFWISFVN